MKREMATQLVGEVQETNMERRLILVPKRSAPTKTGELELELRDAKRRVTPQLFGHSSSIVLGVLCQPYPNPVAAQIGFGRCLTEPFNSKFFDTSSEGTGLMNGKWGVRFDPALKFVATAAGGSFENDDVAAGRLSGSDVAAGNSCFDGKVYVVDSSCGFLLCLNRTDLEENMEYLVCNPITRDLRRLSRPHKAYVNVAVALSCEVGKQGGAPPSIANLNFKVVRAADSDGMMDIEVFTSSTNAWNCDRVVADMPFWLEVYRSSPSPFVIGQLSFLTAFFYDKEPVCPMCKTDAKPVKGLLVYDFSTSSGVAELLMPPPIDVGGFADPSTVCFGNCDGKLMCSQSDRILLQLWQRSDFQKFKAEWVMTHSIKLVNIRVSPPRSRIYAGLCTVGHACPRLLGFHPSDPQLLLASFSSQPFWYHVGKEEACLVGTDGGGMFRSHFVYEWPWALGLYDVTNSISSVVHVTATDFAVDAIESAGF